MVEITLKPVAARTGKAPPSRRGRRRVCLLTGAAGRLGSAFIEKFGATCDIAAIYHRTELPHANQDLLYLDPLDPGAELAENSRSVFGIKADLGSDAALERAVDIALARFGCIDLLINNAADTRFHGSLLDIAALESRFATQMQVNVYAPLKLTALIARKLWSKQVPANRRDNRNVINISSISGLRAFPNGGQAFYGASKAALNHLTAHLSHELRPYGVRANVLAPTRFPDRIPTGKVVEAIAKLDSGSANGMLIVLDETGERPIHGDGSAIPRG